MQTDDYAEFKDFALDCKDEYEKYIKLSKTRTADSCFNSRLAWNYGYEYKYKIIEDCFCPFTSGGKFKQPHIALPLGELNARKLKIIADELGPYVIRTADEEVDESAPVGKPGEIRFTYVDTRYIDDFKAIEGYDVRVSCNRNYSDYVYNADDLRELRGSAFRQKRNHVNRFIRDYPDFVYKQIEQSDKESALALVEKWSEERDAALSDPNKSDYMPISRLFDYMNDLEVYGGAVLYGDEIIAFSMGSLQNEDRAVLHFEKADPTYDGLYAFINQIVTSSEFPDIETVNREEDMGLDNLRQAKESYNPIEMIDKYDVYLSKKSS